MRQPVLPGTVALTVFWVAYAIAAAYVLYEKTPPVSRFVLLVLASYALVVAILTIIVLWHPRRPGPDHSVPNRQ